MKVAKQCGVLVRPEVCPRAQAKLLVSLTRQYLQVCLQTMPNLMGHSMTAYQTYTARYIKLVSLIAAYVLLQQLLACSMTPSHFSDHHLAVVWSRLRVVHACNTASAVKK